MKTLYININGKNIQSTEDIIVIGRSEDAIVNKFFFELGKEILKGVVAPGVTSIKKKDVVTDFKAHDEKSYNLIMEQWEILKQELLGENPSGIRTVKLPDEYISWLQNSSQPAYAEIAKSLYGRGCSVKVSLDKIYKNAIGIIVNNIEPEECKDCGQFVVNDNAVTDDSAITSSIQERMPQITFVPFEDFGKCPKCGKNPCECKPEEPVCPKCGKNPCECEKTKAHNKNKSKPKKSANLRTLFPAHNIVLGKTNIQEIAVSGRIEKTDAGYRYEMNQYAHETFVIQRYEDDFISVMHIDSFRPQMFPDHWNYLLGFSFKSPQDKCLKALKGKGFCLLETSDEWVWNAITPDKRFVFTFRFDYDGLNELEVLPYQCPYCGSKDVEISNSDYDEVVLYCSNCNSEWGAVDSDRSRAEDLDGLNNIENEYEFDEDDYDYDDDLHTYNDKPGKTVQKIYEELLGLTGDDYHLGDTLIDLGIDENLLNEILIRCKQKLSVTITNELNVCKSEISDLIRLVQKYYYIKNKR